jgi:hypothetical protein
MNGGNFYRLTSTYQAWSVVAAAGAYTSNQWVIYARTPAVGNNSSGTASTISFLIEWQDGYLASGPAVAENPPPGDEVYGTIGIAVSTLEATGTLVPSGAGAFAVESPSVSVGTIVPNNTPSYLITPSTVLTDEGLTLTFTISGLAIANGTYSYEVVSAAGTVNASDFTDNTLTGSVAISSNSGSFTKTIKNDTLTEGNNDQFVVRLKSGATVLASTSNIQIIDTSITPPFAFSPTIASNTNSYVVTAAAIAAGWNGVDRLAATITINSGVVVGAGSTGLPAFKIGGFMPPGSSVVLINSGTITGAGGRGGDGGGGAGAAGGPAMELNFLTTIYNYGTITGGGGGGGGGNNGSYTVRINRFNSTTVFYNGGPGGGGAGDHIGTDFSNPVSVAAGFIAGPNVNNAQATVSGCSGGNSPSTIQTSAAFRTAFPSISQVRVKVWIGTNDGNVVCCTVGGMGSVTMITGSTNILGICNNTPNRWSDLNGANQVVEFYGTPQSQTVLYTVSTACGGSFNSRVLELYIR